MRRRSPASELSGLERAGNAVVLDGMQAVPGAKGSRPDSICRFSFHIVSHPPTCNTGNAVLGVCRFRDGSGM